MIEVVHYLGSWVVRKQVDTLSFFLGGSGPGWYLGYAHANRYINETQAQAAALAATLSGEVPYRIPERQVV